MEVSGAGPSKFTPSTMGTFVYDSPPIALLKFVMLPVATDRYSGEGNALAVYGSVHQDSRQLKLPPGGNPVPEDAGVLPEVLDPLFPPVPLFEPVELLVELLKLEVEPPVEPLVDPLEEVPVVLPPVDPVLDVGALYTDTVTVAPEPLP